MDASDEAVLPALLEVRAALERDLVAIRRVALPSHARAIRRDDGDKIQTALTVQHMLAVAQQRAEWLAAHEHECDAAELAELIETAVRAGVYRGRGVRRGDSRPAVDGVQLAARGRPGAARETEDILDEVLELVRGCGAGIALPVEIAAGMASELGGSFDRVRVHVGGHAAAAARLISARAFTIANHIYFDDGEYAPGTEAGDRLLRHELTHVQQHARGRIGPTSTPQLIEESSGLELEARAAEQSAPPHGATPTPAPAVTSSDATPVIAARTNEPEPSAPSPETLPDGVDNYAITPDLWSVRISTKWLMVDPKQRLYEVLAEMKQLGAFAWATEEGLRHAAANITLTSSDPVVRYHVVVGTFALMGLPPLAGSIVGRRGDDLQVALKVPNVKVPPPGPDVDRFADLGPGELNELYKAVGEFTHLEVQNKPRFRGFIARDGILEIEIPDRSAAEMFGKQAWEDWKRKPTEATHGGGTSSHPTTTSHDLSLSERVVVDKWLTDHLELSSTASVARIDRSMLNIIDEFNRDPALLPILKQLVAKRRTGIGTVSGILNLGELLDASKQEKERHRLGTDKLEASTATPIDPASQIWDIMGRIDERGLVFAGSSTKLTVELDWDGWKMFRSAADIDRFAKRRSHYEIEWAIERTDKKAVVTTKKQVFDNSRDMSLTHTFELATGETTGTFTVHAFMKSAHFVPKHFQAVIEVKTEEARMEELRDREMSDMTTARMSTMHYKFDIGTGQKILDKVGIGSAKDTEGYAFSGPLPKDFKHRDAKARAKSRSDELELQKKLAAYLRKQAESGKPGYSDAVNAAEQRVKFLEDTEKKVASDSGSSWKPFEVRATYLSRNDSALSGPLDLYGSYVVSSKIGQSPKFDVRIRDLTNKIDRDMEFTGDSEHFDDALREAFVKLCKQYPSGRISLLAEDHEVGLNGRPNGSSIGYELATTSGWKRVKSAVWDPAVTILTSAAAMAVMVVFPGSAAVIVPMLAVHDLIRNVDELLDKRDKHTLSLHTAKINLLQIGLDVLPAARSAKILSPAKSAVQEAKGMVNLRLVMFDTLQFAGQALVMYERTREELARIQDQQIAAMAEKYAAVIALEKAVANREINASDPGLAKARLDIEKSAAAVRKLVMTTWADAVAQQATFFVGSHLVGGHQEAAAGRRSHEDTQFAPKSKVVDVERVILAGDDAELRAAAKLVRHEEGTLDVFVHGGIDDFEVTINGKDITLDHRRLATYIKKLGGDFQRIRLLSCKTGMHPKGAAQHLANKLGVIVEAPTDKLYIHPDGSLTIGPHETRNTGTWQEFKPGKSELRFEKAPEPPEAAAPQPRSSGAKQLGAKEDRAALVGALTEPAVKALESELGGRFATAVADVTPAAVIAAAQKLGVTATGRLISTFSADTVRNVVAIADNAGLTFDATGTKATYRYSGTSALQERGFKGVRMTKTSDASSGARKLEANGFTFTERGRYADVRIDPANLAPTDSAALTKLWSDYSIVSAHAKARVFEAIESERIPMKGGPAQPIDKAIKAVRPVLDEIKAQAASSKRSVDEILAKGGSAPIVGGADSAHIVASAQHAIADGILKDPGFLSSRKVEEARDVLARGFKRTTTKQRAEAGGSKGGEVLIDIKFKGSLFDGETSSSYHATSDGKPRKDVDVAPDIDSAYVVKHGDNYVIEYLGSVKITNKDQAGGANNDAKKQAELNKQALRAGGKRFPVEVDDPGIRGAKKTVWAAVTAVEGKDGTGKAIDLTNKLTLDAKVRTETLGVTDHFDAKLMDVTGKPVEEKTLNRIVETIWRMAEMGAR